jgi:molybdate transport system permease protein
MPTCFLVRLPHTMKSTIRLPLRLVLPASLVLILLLGLPSLIVIARAISPSFVNALISPTVTEALRLSLLTTLISLALTLLLGTPLAYFLARYQFWGKRVLETLLELPIVLPPTVAGVALLLTFGRRGWIGSYLNDMGITIAFTTTAVVLAQLFVASPLYIRSMRAAFANISERLEGAAMTLGATRVQTFWRVTLPLTMPYFLEGLILSWARALGEFGATIVFAGSLQGRTQTMPLAIYAALEQDLDTALVISAILTVVAFGLLLVFRQIVKERV